MRRKIAILSGILLCLSLGLGAVPAPKTPFRYVQPDGSVLTLTNHGDEYFHWTTDAGGQIVELSKDGFWKVADREAMTLRRNAARIRRAADDSRRLARSNAPALSERRFLVVLVEFADLKFTLPSPKEAFTALLNEEGYSDNGATGSVRDFYVDNSRGRFSPVFDVFGPVEVSEDAAYYGGSNPNSNDDELAHEAFLEACRKLNGQIDFSKYDSDGDSLVDAVFFYYAGHNQAEGGGASCIWPHEWDFRGAYGYSELSFDGKYLSVYSCASEFSGSSGSNMCGIGTACHEFGHAMGLPDMYDTDYATNGQAGGLYEFSTMCGGSYNNNSRTPASFNCIERHLLGWMDWPENIKKSGSVTIRPITENVAYWSPATTEGEYFIYEFRDASGWDGPLPMGMVVYHYDCSDRQVSLVSSYGQYSVKARTLWEDWGSYNALNQNGDHPCFYVVPASEQSSLNYYGTLYSMVFPYYNITSYTPIDWNGNQTGYSFTNIRIENGLLKMVASIPAREFFLSGTVRDEDGAAISGALVSVALYGSDAKFSGRTDNSGKYNISVGELSGTFSITVSSEGFVPSTREVETDYGDAVLDFVLSREPPKYPDLGFNYIGLEQESYAAGDTLLFELALTAGQKPTAVSWSFDGIVRSSKSVVLTKGEHLLSVRLSFADGSSQVLERWFDIQ